MGFSPFCISIIAESPEHGIMNSPQDSMEVGFVIFVQDKCYSSRSISSSFCIISSNGFVKTSDSKRREKVYKANQVFALAGFAILRIRLLYLHKTHNDM